MRNLSRACLLRRRDRPAAGSGRWSETQSALRASKESVSGGALRIGRQFPSASRRHRHIHCTPTPPTYTWDSVLHPREKPDGQRRVELHLHGSGSRLSRLRLDDREAREPGGNADVQPEQPNKTSGTNRWGWGMCQIDRGRTGLVTRTVYDWKTNVDQMNATLTEKASVHERFMGYYRSAYAGRPNWSDPELATTNVLGRSVTARDWSIMTLYNGTSGLESRVVSGHTIYPPVHFDSTNGRWLFSPNANDYVRKVIQDANVNPEE